MKETPQWPQEQVANVARFDFCYVVKYVVFSLKAYKDSWTKQQLALCSVFHDCNQNILTCIFMLFLVRRSEIAAE